MVPTPLVVPSTLQLALPSLAVRKGNRCCNGRFGANKVHAHFGQGNGRVGYVLEGARVIQTALSVDGGGDTGFTKSDWMLKLHANNGVASRIFQRVELKLGYADESSNETYLKH